MFNIIHDENEIYGVTLKEEQPIR